MSHVYIFLLWFIDLQGSRKHSKSYLVFYKLRYDEKFAMGRVSTEQQEWPVGVLGAGSPRIRWHVRYKLLRADNQQTKVGLTTYSMKNIPNFGRMRTFWGRQSLICCGWNKSNISCVEKRDMQLSAWWKKNLSCWWEKKTTLFGLVLGGKQQQNTNSIFLLKT